MQIRFLGQNNPLEKEMAAHCSILARINPTDRGAWQAVVHDNTESGTRLSTQPLSHLYRILDSAGNLPHGV